MDELNQGLSSLVRFGVSDQLIQDMQVIEESCDINGNALYEQAAIYEMRCAILCRNYAKSLWEYSHYVALIEHESEHGVIHFFWEQDIVSSARFKQWLTDTASHSACLNEHSGVINAMMGQREFTFNPKRINLMVAWTAFLAIVEPNLLTRLAGFKCELDDRSIDDLAKHLKASLDQYLEPHLQAIHQQRQGRVLLSWLQARLGEQNPNMLVQDESVLAFWQQNALSEEGDFKRFTSVAECAYRLHQAIELSDGQRAIAGARSYHQDQQGENAAWLLDEVSQLKAEENLFEGLMRRDPSNAVANLRQAPLNQIKFLTQKDAEFCEKFERVGAALSRLPLTFLRAQVFGLQQARVTEDLRATKGRNLRNLIELEDFSGFAAWADSLSEQIERIDQTRLAVAYILLQHAHPEALTRLLEALSDEQKTLLQNELKNQSGALQTKHLVHQLNSLAPLEIKRLESAFAKVNRAGFKELPEAAQVTPYLLGDEYLSALENQISLYAALLNRQAEQLGGLARIEADDAQIFSQTFALLYAEQGVHA